MTKLTSNPCELCNPASEDLLWQDPLCRVVGVADERYPGFCRVILNAHVKEMTDLQPSEQNHLMHVVLLTERVVRELAEPDKVNLASLGNVVPHLHWHVIPRWHDDGQFPAPIWADAGRDSPVRPRTVASWPEFRARLKLALSGNK